MELRARARGWSKRAEEAHRRRPWIGVGAAVLAGVAGLAASAGAGDGDGAAGSASATTVAPATTEPVVGGDGPVPETTATTAPAGPTDTTATTATTAPPGTEIVDGVVVPVLAPTTTTTRPAPPTTAVPGPGDPPPVSAECTPGYDPCIRPGDDVDCEGTGDGPRHVRGPVYVEGRDTYGLDADGNGVACEGDANF